MLRAEIATEENRTGKRKTRRAEHEGTGTHTIEAGANCFLCAVSQGCNIGCEACTGMLLPGRQCNSTLEPTLPKWAWTMNVAGRDSADPKDHDSYRYFPWRAPGMA